MLGLAACNNSQTGMENAGNHHSGTHNDAAATNAIPVTTNSAKAFSMDFKAEPNEINAGTPAVLAFTVKDRQGAIVKDLPIVHEKPMHLLIVSKDLAEFYHIHPEQSEDGSYRVTHTFPNGGDYKLYADFTPKDSKQVVEQIDVKVVGAERAKVALVPDQKLEKTVDGLRVVLKPDAEIKAGQELMLNFQAFDAASGKPATNLENYLGELAHFVIISEDMKDFVHAHPMSKSEHQQMSGGGHAGMKMGDKKGDDHNADNHSHSGLEGVTTKESASEVSAHTAFPRTGLYKVWAQFRRGGRVITVPFTIRAGEGNASFVKDYSAPADAIKVTVSSNGYQPSEIKLEKGKLAKIAFYRTDADNCGGEVVFSKLNIKKKLPVGETVLVEFTPTESGDLGFACGMDMMKGKVMVN
jgi:uncharacterized cupredoxin-like copper-binding protein